MKTYRILYTIFTVFIISCNIDPIEQVYCRNFKLEAEFIDSITGMDITGDSINLPTIRYDKDSIRYKIVSEEDSSDFLVPTITKGTNFLVYTFNGFNISKNTNAYTMIMYYNENESDSLFITISKSGEIEIFHTENLKLTTITPRTQCSSFLIIRK